MVVVAYQYGYVECTHRKKYIVCIHDYEYRNELMNGKQHSGSMCERAILHAEISVHRSIRRFFFLSFILFALSWKYFKVLLQ